MTGPASISPASAALSPVLIAGFALRMLPRLPLQALVRVAVGGLRRSHPRIFERFGEFGDALIAVYPSDLPFGFTLHFGGEAVFDARLHDLDTMPTDATATIRGAFPLLVCLLEGTIDGDAVFFSRDFAFEGDTEVILRLRNMLESEEIDLASDLLRGFGLPAPVARELAGRARRLSEAAGRDLKTLHEAIIGPLRVRQDALGTAVDDLRAHIERLERDLRRVRSARGKAERTRGPVETTGTGPGLPAA